MWDKLWYPTSQRVHNLSIYNSWISTATQWPGRGVSLDGADDVTDRSGRSRGPDGLHHRLLCAEALSDDMRIGLSGTMYVLWGQEDVQ